MALYSEEFSASGVDKLRMKLYLHGKCEADDGWCPCLAGLDVWQLELSVLQ